MTVRVNKSSFNIREKLSELGRKFGLKGSELAAAETVQEARDLVSAGRKNMCINGAMQVAQRVAYPSTQPGVQYGGYYTVDRFQSGVSAAGTWTISQSTDVPDGFANSIKYDCTTANTSLASGSELWIAQKIEAQNLQHLDYDRTSCRDCTFSFYMKTNKTGVYTVEIFQADANRTIGFEAEVTQTGWARYEFVVPGDPSGTINNDNGIGLWLFIWMATGTSKTSGTFTNGKWAGNVTSNRLSPSQVNFADSTSNELYITGYQFELGRNATEFEHRSFGEELALCQRYYCKSYKPEQSPGAGTSNGIQVIRNYDPNNSRSDHPAGVQFPVTMRDIPNITFYSQNGTANRFTVGNSTCGSFVNQGGTIGNILLKGTGSIGGISFSTTVPAASFAYFHFTAESEL